jgi:hypothetical protein
VGDVGDDRLLEVVPEGLARILSMERDGSFWRSAIIIERTATS